MTPRAHAEPACRQEAGISLAEIPVALVVVAMVLVLAIRTFSTAGTVQRDSHSGNQATAYGTAKLHQLAGFSAASLAAGRDTVMNAEGKVFTRAWTVADKASCKEVNVTVSWRSRNRDESILLGTLIR